MSYYEQPGRTTAIDDTGKQVTTITYIGNEEASVPTAISGTIKSKAVVKSEAGQIRTQYQIQQNSSGDGGGGGGSGGYTIEIVSSVRTVPIETHPKFGGDQITYGGNIAPAGIKLIKDTVATPGKTFDDISGQVVEYGPTGDCRKLYEFLSKGVESYYLPSLIIRKTYQSSGTAGAGTVGKITSPGVSISGMPTGATFLLINVSARGTSGAYTITEEYEMSGQGGWDTYLYNPS